MIIWDGELTLCSILSEKGPEDGRFGGFFYRGLLIASTRAETPNMSDKRMNS
jgi:hypothetical protein